MSSPIQRARIALSAYAASSFPEGELANDPETVVSDLIADLIFYCDKVNLDYESCKQRGERHYAAEVYGEETTS
jgi:hypothetical protein